MNSSKVHSYKITRNKLVSIISSIVLLASYGLFAHVGVPVLVFVTIFSIAAILYGLFDKFEGQEPVASYYICISPNSLILPIVAGNLINLYSPDRAYRITSSLLILAVLCSTAIKPSPDSNSSFKREEFNDLKFIKIIRILLIIIYLAMLTVDIYSLITHRNY